MARYEGQHFTDVVTSRPRVSSRHRLLPAAGGIAAALVIAAGGFVAGRMTADDGGNAGGIVVIPSTTVAPSPGNELVDQGVVLHNAGKLDEALAIYNQALAKDPKNKLALYNIAQIAQTRKQYDTAIENYKAALAVDSKYGPAMYNLGLTYGAKGDRTNAITTLRKTLEITPTANHAPVLYNLGTLLIQDGKNDEGAKLIAQAIALDPSIKPKS